MSLITECIKNKKTEIKPIWLMRQAGRYLPEFRKIRLKNPDFIKLCLNENLSSEITLQPLKRFDFDAAIIFSDILMLPFGLGQKVEFKKNFGPLLGDLNLNKFQEINEDDFTKKLNPVYNAIKKVKKDKLLINKDVIGFVGAPWTLLVYMMGLKENKNKVNLLKIRNEKLQMNVILDKLHEYLCIHIENQINAGADVVQIFDSWAGLLTNEDLINFCYIPNLKIVEFCKSKKIPVICFPKGIKENYIEFNSRVKPDGLNLDYEIDPVWAKKNLTNVVLQGGMNPKTLLQSEEEIYKEAKKYLDIFKDVPYIFNLGHGLMPETNPDKLGKLIKFVKEYK